MYPEVERATLAQIVAAPQFAQILSIPMVAWQEIGLIATCYAVLICGTALATTGWAPYPLVMVAHALAIYTIFTPLHDATHGALSSNRNLNDLLGTLAALPLFPGLSTKLYRILHMEHHKLTGEAGADPDEATVAAPMPIRVLVWMFVDLYWIGWYLRRAGGRPWREWLAAGASLLFLLGWHAAWLMSPYAIDFVLLWLIPQRLGITLLVYLFAAIQHPEGIHQRIRPFQTTRMMRGGTWTRLMTLSQAQHLFHHLFPTVPYYRYDTAWILAAHKLRQHEIVWGQIFGRQPQPKPARPVLERPPLTATVIAVERVAEDVLAYTLASAPGQTFPPYAPGAHIDVFLDGGIVRQSSLCTGFDRKHYRIAVKLEVNGRGGSRALQAEWKPGVTVRVGVRRNMFPMAKHDFIVLMAVGIGITPLLAMAETLHAEDQVFEFHVCARSP